MFKTISTRYPKDLDDFLNEQGKEFKIISYIVTVVPGEKAYNDRNYFNVTIKLND